MSSNSSALSLFDQPQAAVERIVKQVEKVIVGKREAIELTVMALLCSGHVLLEDVPGVGKTLLVRSLAQALDLSFKRIQCTPDLLPSDVTGISVFNQKWNEFEFRHGPIFAQLVLADELNRTSTKTQAALLEAMEERQVTVDGQSHRLPDPFFVIATQNPLDCEGTYVLPEAQLDRFLVRVRIGYPAAGDEVEMLGRIKEKSAGEPLRPVLFKEELLELQRLVRQVHVDDAIKEYVVELVAATRSSRDLALGASPRASIALMRLAQAKAFIGGRTYVVPDDVKHAAPHVLAHRLVLSQEALIQGKAAERIVQMLVGQTAVPGIRFAAGS